MANKKTKKESNEYECLGYDEKLISSSITALNNGSTNVVYCFCKEHAEAINAGTKVQTTISKVCDGIYSITKMGRK